MPHQPYAGWMQDVLDGALAHAARPQFEAHLAGCAECRASWAGLEAAHRLLKAAPLAAPAPGFSRRFQARLAQRRSRPRLIWGGVALGAGAVAVSALVLPLVLGLVVSLLRAAQEPATAMALADGLAALAGYLETLLDAVGLAGRAALSGVVASPLAWAATATALLLTVAWLFVMRRFVSEVPSR